MSPEFKKVKTPIKSNFLSQLNVFYFNIYLFLALFIKL